MLKTYYCTTSKFSNFSKTQTLSDITGVRGGTEGQLFCLWRGSLQRVPLDIDLVCDGASVTPFSLTTMPPPHHLSFTSPSQALLLYPLLLLLLPLSLPPLPTLPLASVPAEHPFMCLKCRAQKMKVCVDVKRRV